MGVEAYLMGLACGAFVAVVALVMYYQPKLRAKDREIERLRRLASAATAERAKSADPFMEWYRKSYGPKEAA